MGNCISTSNKKKAATSSQKQRENEALEKPKDTDNEDPLLLIKKNTIQNQEYAHVKEVKEEKKSPSLSSDNG